jgi:hypothetical protein
MTAWPRALSAEQPSTHRPRPPVQELVERYERIAQLTRAGWTRRAIAQELGICTRTVERARIATGCAQPVPPRLTDEQLAAAEALLDDGAAYIEAGRTIGAAGRTVARHFPGRGWTQSQAAEYRNARNAFRAVLA